MRSKLVAIEPLKHLESPYRSSQLHKWSAGELLQQRKTFGTVLNKPCGSFLCSFVDLALWSAQCTYKKCTSRVSLTGKSFIWIPRFAYLRIFMSLVDIPMWFRRHQEDARNGTVFQTWPGGLRDMAQCGVVLRSPDYWESKYR